MSAPKPTRNQPVSSRRLWLQALARCSTTAIALPGVMGRAASFGISTVPMLSQATPGSSRDALRAQFGEQPIKPGRVTLKIPALAENGNSVGLVVNVDSPMTESDFVDSIHIFAPRNPLPTVLELQLGPLAGRAQVATRMRLADSQTITAVARMNDRSLWSGTASIVVTLAACTDYLF